MKIIHDYSGEWNHWKEGWIRHIELVSSLLRSIHTLFNSACSFGGIADRPLLVGFVSVRVRALTPNACVLARGRVNSCYESQKLPIAPKVVLDVEYSLIDSNGGQFLNIIADVMEAFFH